MPILALIWVLIIISLMTDGNEAHLYTGIGLLAAGTLLIALLQPRNGRE
jgi:hypothetical protein